MASARTTDQSVMRAGSGVKVDTSAASAPAAEYALEAAERGEHHRLDEELPPDVAPPRAERLAEADLVGPFGDAHQHDVHDHDAADDDPDADDGRNGGEEDAGELAPEGHEGVGLVDGEVVRLSRPEPMRDPHRLFGARHGAFDFLRRAHLDRDDRRLASPVERLEGGEGQQDEAIERLAEHSSLLRDHALDRDLASPDPQLLADGAFGAVEELVGDVEAEHADEPALP